MVVVGIFAMVVSIFVNGFVWGIWLDLFGFVLNCVLDCERRPRLLVGGGGQWAVVVACWVATVLYWDEFLKILF